MSLKEMVGNYGFVAKVDVSDLNASTDWYQGKLGLMLDERYSTPTWRQFTLPDLPSTAIGCNLNAGGVGSGGAVSTFVVVDIETARNNLLAQGIDVGAIVDVGDGVLLCFFKDPDGNALGLRQNAPEQPSPA
jgi:glyoxylase I family protein